MQQTTNYNLFKPDATDTVEPTSREAFNSNADIIDNNLKAINDKFFYVSISGNSSATKTLSNNTRALLCLIGASGTQGCEYLVNVNGAGNVMLTEIKGNSGVTVTSGTNSITIANSNSSYLFVHAIIFNGDIF